MNTFRQVRLVSKKIASPYLMGFNTEVKKVFKCLENSRKKCAKVKMFLENSSFDQPVFRIYSSFSYSKVLIKRGS